MSFVRPDRKGAGRWGGPEILLFAAVLLSAASIVFLSSCGQSGRGTVGQVREPVSTEQSSEPDIEEMEPGQVDESPSTEPEPMPPPDITEVVQPDHPIKDLPLIPRVEFDSVELVREVVRGPVGGGMIALTFDAGASARPTPPLLRVLAEKELRCTFFLTGKWIDANPELAAQIVVEGHEIGNHTYSHRDLQALTDDDIREELSRTEKSVRAITGVTTKPYFRAPYGARDDRVIGIAASEGYRSIRWSADSWDAFKKGITAAEIEQRVLDRAEDGAIVLMHCGSWSTVDALPRVIDGLRARGYRLVTVSELLGGGR